MILVSACFLGHKQRYDGGSNPHGLLLLYNACQQFMPICPECLAGLSVPRPPAEIVGGTGCEVIAGQASVKNKRGEPVTESFCQGAAAVRKIAEENKVKYAILKENSPSCGVHEIYDGSFSGQKIHGQGVCAALLAAAGVTLYSEKDLSPDLLEKILREDAAGNV